MILSLERTISRLVAEHGWTRVTLDQMFRRGLARDPGGVVFEDAGPAAVPGRVGSLTFAEAHRRIDALASFFAGIGLKPDTVLGIHLPPSSDAVVVVLAALRVGLIVCPLPLHLTRGEMTAVVAAANIRGIVTATSVDGQATGEMVRDVAAETFAIRFVFSIGSDAPDGLIDLGGVFADLDQFGPPPDLLRRGSPSDHIALLSLARAADDRPVVVPFSHNHLVATALAHSLEAGADAGEVILATMHPASLAGVAGALATALVSGGSVAFHHPASLSGLVGAADAVSARRLVIPAAIGAAVDRMLPPGVALSLVSSGLDPRGAPDLPPERPALDLLTLGAHCLLPVLRRTDGTQGMLPLGPYRPLGSGDDGPVLFETTIKPRVKSGERRAASGNGDLLLCGAMIPDAPWPEPASGGSGAGLSFGADGALKPGLLAQASADGLDVRLRGPVGDGLMVGGRTVSPSRLDALLQSHPALADAAVFAIETDVIGARLGAAVVPKAGESVDPEGIGAFLDGHGVGALDWPSTVVTVAEIPRTADGAVMRQALFLSAVA